MRISLYVAVLFLTTMVGQIAYATTDPGVGDARMRPVDATRHAIDIANGFLRNNDVTDARSALDDVVRSTGFRDLSDDEKYQVLSFSGNLALEHGDNASAHRLLVRASEFAQASGLDWHRRLAAAFALDDFVDSAHCIASIAKRWPQSMDQINPQAVSQVEMHLRNDSTPSDTFLEMLANLFAVGWTDNGVQPSLFWFDLTRLRLKQGDVEKAASAAARVDAPRLVVRLRVDKRFDLVTDASKGAFDVDRVTGAEIAQARARAQASAEQLRPVVDLQYALLDNRDFAQVLALCNAVIARADNGNGAKVFKDFNDYYVWILDNRSRALQGLGRWDDAVAQQRKASRRPEHGAMNVSQTLNLGELYADLDRPDEALAAVSDLGTASPYGRMQLESVKLTAAVERDDKSAIQEHLHFMREHRADALGTYQRALLVANRLDAAATLLIERLRSDVWRGRALTAMQHYAAVPMPPRVMQTNARWRAVIARPEVQSELTKVGRIEQINLAPPSD